MNAYAVTAHHAGRTCTGASATQTPGNHMKMKGMTTMQETKTTPTEELVDTNPQTQHLVHTVDYILALLDTSTTQVTAYCGHVIHKSPGPDTAMLKCPVCLDLIGKIVLCPNCGHEVMVQG